MVEAARTSKYDALRDYLKEQPAGEITLLFKDASTILGFSLPSSAYNEAARGVAKQRIESDGGVIDAPGVALKRACAQTGVGLRRRNARQRERQNEYRNKDGEKPSRIGRMTKHIIPFLFVEFVSSTRTA
jgi:hypothetical protein